MNNPKTYRSQAYNLRDMLTSAAWELYADKLLRISKKQRVEKFLYAQIDTVRLCFHMGGRGSAAKFCCYFSVNGKWSSKQMLSSAHNDAKTENYKTYRGFVLEFIREIKQANPSVRLIVGHSWSSWLFYLVTVVFLLCVPVFTYQQHISNDIESLIMGLVLLLLSSPLIVSMVKYFPRVLHEEDKIPNSVLPAIKIP